jgi:hypothetical protein
MRVKLLYCTSKSTLTRHKTVLQYLYATSNADRYAPFQAAMAIKRLALRYAVGGAGTPFFIYATLVRQCVAISTANIYFSSPSGTPPFAHLKQSRPAPVSFLAPTAMTASEIGPEILLGKFIWR